MNPFEQNNGAAPAVKVVISGTPSRRATAVKDETNVTVQPFAILGESSSKKSYKVAYSDGKVLWQDRNDIAFAAKTAGCPEQQGFFDLTGRKMGLTQGLTVIE